MHTGNDLTGGNATGGIVTVNSFSAYGDRWRYCPADGTQLAGIWSFCPICGKPIGTA